MTSSPPNTDVRNGNFICGVVEGFYGRPWTTEQRKDLFRKLKKWGMDSYVYAPKDDYKHRAYWRELYTVEEADHLTSLIAAAKEQGIVFYYALSPGLDMTYSNQKEITALKRKLEQVSQFGCEAFALLFDDIESELSKSDKEAFQTFANAQVSVTNEIYNHLNGPRFLFCPTQYCSSRAVPSVTHSEYLNTLGSKLCPEIDIMWTGSKVISKTLSVESIQEITEILRRPPVIWDNLHANDYDQKRVFLGPYSGRSPELIPLLRGVLTNPNCEFYANTVAIYTLAYWSKCSLDTKINNSISADIKLETENDDGISNEDAPVSLSKNIYHPRVALKNAIMEWLPEFFIEKEAWGPISKPQPPLTMVMPIIPILPSVNTCMSLTTTTTTTSSSACAKIPEVNTNQLQALADVCSTVTATNVTPIPNAIMNSLVSPTKVVTNDSLPNPIVTSVSNFEIPSKIPISSIPIPIMNIKNEDSVDSIVDEKSEDADATSLKNSEHNEQTMHEHSTKNATIEEDVTITEAEANNLNNGEPSVEIKSIQENVSMTDGVSLPSSPTEPMECGSSLASQSSPKPMAKSPSDDVVMSETVSTSSGSMQVEGSDTSLTSSADMNEDFEKTSNEKAITVEDLYLLCDLFYLPFEHGSRGLQLLNEFNWLKMNACILLHSGRKPDNSKPEVQEWLRRADKFSTLCQSVLVLSRKIACCTNRELVYDLFSYVWDIAGVISLLNAFVKWLSLGTFPVNINSYTQGSYTWFSKGWREMFMSGDQEPWIFRGGLTSDLQRLIPVDSGNDLFIYKLPDIPTPNYYLIRPYSNADEDEIYRVCQKKSCDESISTELYPENIRNITADHLVGPFVTINPELCMVVQNASNVMVGYACAALDARIFYRNQEMCWVPAMCEKYPLSLMDSDDLPTTAKKSIQNFHHFKYDCPSEVLNTHPSIMTCFVLDEEMATDQSVGKRLVIVLLAALRSNGSFGVHVCINQSDSHLFQFYSKMGFSEIYRDSGNSRIYLGRNF